jgi:hypothetical protein
MAWSGSKLNVASRRSLRVLVCTAIGAAVMPTASMAAPTEADRGTSETAMSGLAGSLQGSLDTEPQPLPEPENHATPYESTIGAGVEQNAAEASERQVAQYRREQEEREANKSQTSEPPATTSVTVCRVPRLKGDSLAQAKTKLIHNHCQLGRVTRPSRSHGRLTVVAQSRPPGATLAKGSVVAVRLSR